MWTVSEFRRPLDCGFCNEDLECLGCGVKLRTLKPGECYGVEYAKREAEQKEREERAQLAYLKAKYPEEHPQ